MNNSNVLPFPTIKRQEPLEAKITRLEAENAQLRSDISTERSLRYDAEQKLKEYLESKEKITPRQKRVKINEDGKVEEYSKYKTDGVLKPRPADSIRSYNDFVSIQQYFWDRNQIRNWMIWTVGVSLGLRVSDINSLKYRSVLNNDLSFRERILINEQKTGKLNNCLITESVRYAIEKYIESIDWNFNMDDPICMSQKTGKALNGKSSWKILSNAGKDLSLPIIVGSNTMRKSFANIAACVDKSSIDMNTITKIQGLLNHSSQTTTMRYLGKLKEMYDKARIATSDFVMGKTNINELVAGTDAALNDIITKLDAIEAQLHSN